MLLLMYLSIQYNVEKFSREIDGKPLARSEFLEDNNEAAIKLGYVEIRENDMVISKVKKILSTPLGVAFVRARTKLTSKDKPLMYTIYGFVPEGFLYQKLYAVVYKGIVVTKTNDNWAGDSQFAHHSRI